MILGEQVRLRRPEHGDLARFAVWLNDLEVRRHLALVYPMSEVLEEDGRYLDTLLMGVLRDEFERA